MLNIKTYLFFLLLAAAGHARAQQGHALTGRVPQAAGREVVLRGFFGTRDSVIATATTDAAGRFVLAYPQGYTGAAALQAAGSEPAMLLLAGEAAPALQWDTIASSATLHFKRSAENDALVQGAAIYSRSRGRLAGLYYLLPQYAAGDPLHATLQQAIAGEEQALPAFLAGLPAGSYAAYYMRLRSLATDLALAAKERPQGRAAAEQAFLALNFADERLLHSGLFNDLMQGYCLLAEATGTDAAATAQRINTGTDAVITGLAANPAVKQDAAEYLFKLLEGRSLFAASEHVALAMLDAGSCQLDGRREALFEQYRSMAIGHTAPDAAFSQPLPGRRSLYDVHAKYKLVVFGSSWCPACAQEIPKLQAMYPAFKAAGAEVILFSLDTNRVAYQAFVKDFPWQNSCDLKGWESTAARQYYVMGTPTMYLLDADNRIILKPHSAAQAEAWMKAYAGRKEE